MKVIIQDHQDDKQDSWGSIIRVLAMDANVQIVDLDPCPDLQTISQTYNSADTIVFVHSPLWESWDYAQEQQQTPLQCIVVHVGTGGFSGTPSAYQGRRYFSQFTAKAFRDCGNGKRFFESVATAAPDWTLLNPPATEHILALRILCEAWEMNEGAESKIHDSVTIYAPTVHESWFAPFKVGEADEVNASSVAELMGDASLVKETEKMLKAVEQGKPLNDLIISLLKEFRKPLGGI